MPSASDNEVCLHRQSSRIALGHDRQQSLLSWPWANDLDVQSKRVCWVSLMRRSSIQLADCGTPDVRISDANSGRGAHLLQQGCHYDYALCV